MALKKGIYTARPKRASDGAVSARYTKAKPKADTRSGQEKKLAQRLLPEELTEKKPAGGRMGKAPQRKSAASKDADRRTTAKRTGEKQPEKKTEKKTEKKPAEKKTPVRRAVMADEKTARRAKSEKRREPGRARRARARSEAAMRDRRRAVSRGIDLSTTVIALLTALFVAGGLLLCAVRAGTMDVRALKLMAVAVPVMLLTTLVLPRFLPVDPLLMALTNFLCGVGIVLLYTVSPERGVRQTNFYLLGIVGMLAVSQVVFRIRKFHALTWAGMLIGIAALVMPLVFGEWNNGAKNWVELPVLGSFQPSELVKLSLVLAMAYYFSAHRTVMQMMPAILFAGACLLLLMLQRDLGTALIYYATTLALFYAACGNVPLTMLGLGGGAAAAVMGYRMFAHVKVRVAMWRNPWSDPLDKGYQIIQALLAIGSGGLFGVGLGQGTPEKIPAYYNDFIFAVVCEQLGLVFGLLLLAVYVLLVLRGVSLISRSRRSLHMLLGCGVLAMLAIQTFMIVGGVIKMLPLTGVTMPFLSYGGSSLLSCLMMIGILHGISARAQEDMEEDVFAVKG